MKKFIKVIALAMVIVTLTATLASCFGGGLSGTYAAVELGTGMELEFKGSKVTMTYKFLGEDIASLEGKYTIKDDKISFEFNTDDIENDLLEEAVKELNGEEADFEKGDDYIKIDGIKYTKED